MFHRKRIILFISKYKIIVYRITLKKKPIEEILGQYDWTNQTLESLLAQITKRFGKNIRILLDDSLTYITSVSFPPGKTYSREEIRKQAQEIIPESLKETMWDTRDITSFTHSENKTFQVVALLGSFYSAFNASCNKLQINIVDMEPLSFAIAESVFKEKDPVVVMYVNHGILFILVYKGMVLVADKTSDEFSISVLTTFLNFVARNVQTPYKKIILAGTFEEKHTKALLEAKIAAETFLISPYVNLALKVRSRNRDEEFFDFNSLRQEVEKISTESHQKAAKIEQDEDTISEEKKPGQHKNSKVKNIFLIIFLVILWSGMGYMAYNYFFPKRKAIPLPQSIKPTIPPSSTPTQLIATQSATQSEDDLLNFSYTILNGSGISGEATRLSEILKEKGITNIEVGNAPQTSENTVIASKKEVSEKIIDSLDNFLRDNYDNIVHSELPNGEKSDIVITIGLP